MLIIEKILRFIFVWYGGNLFLVSMEYFLFFYTSEKKLQLNILRNSLMLHMKIFLFNFNDFTITKWLKIRGTEYKENAGLNYLVWPFSERRF